MRVQACATRRSSKMSDNAMLDKGRAVQCRAVIQRGRAVKENITSGQSGDCLVYLGPAYIHEGIDGTIFNRPMGCRALWESMKRPWESFEMPGQIEGLELPTVGIIIPNKEWVRAPFLIRLYGFAPPSPTPFMDVHLSI